MKSFANRLCTIGLVIAVAFAALWLARRSAAADPPTVPMPLTATTENIDLGVDTSNPPTKTWATTEGIQIGSYGTTDMAAAPGDIVAVEYIGRLGTDANGKIFDSSFQHHPPDPIVFVLGNHQVIPGWEIGIAGMHLGEVRKLTIPPEQAYGKDGSKDGTIPQNATLTFMVKLVGLRKG